MRMSHRPARIAVVAALLLAPACGEAEQSTTSVGATASASAAATGDGQEYRTRATVLEEPGGMPMMCHAVAESYPPQCHGPEIVGWDWKAVDGEESANGVTWTGAVLTGTWDGERFTLTRPVEVMSAWPEPPPEDPSTFAPGCADPDVVDPSHGVDQVSAVIEPLERAGASSIRVSDPTGLWDGPFVLTVLVPPGQADRITDLVRRDYLGPLCVLERDLPTMEEMAELQDEVTAATAAGDTPLGPALGSVPDPEQGVLLVQVIAATPEARAWAEQRWGDRVVLDPMLLPVD
jgi:hypothetical protein